MNREYHRWYSERLGRTMELLVFGHAGAKVLVFPTRDGRFHEKVAAFSGRYDLTLNVDDFRDLFSGHRDALVYYHTPVQYLANLHCPERLAALRRMDIVLVVGNEDPFLENNRYLSRLLWEKGIRHSLHEWDGRAHRGSSWRRMAPLYV
ncbi:hypothetical protein [uncultured Thiodictyon sp.]|jgi:esterase/lipase superfamily enzyme|uniref:hypothetical protein n=1 Tax=uncultured Thiodictyon sp. TaxID=1846217 RepID=UPI0025D516B6|nr:hypothetical protein [uncultured Thiodictyon sp.]